MQGDTGALGYGDLSSSDSKDMNGDTRAPEIRETSNRESQDMKGDTGAPESQETSTRESQDMQGIMGVPGSGDTSTRAGNSLHPAQQTVTDIQQKVTFDGQKQAFVSSSLASHQVTLKLECQTIPISVWQYLISLVSVRNKGPFLL